MRYRHAMRERARLRRGDKRLVLSTERLPRWGRCWRWAAEAELTPHPDPKAPYHGVRVRRKGRSEAEALRRTIRAVQAKGLWEMRHGS